VSDLGGKIEGLHVALGLYAPNAYPFRDMNHVNGKSYFVENANGGFAFPSAFDTPPPPTRYDTIYSDAAVILPSVVRRASSRYDLSNRSRGSSIVVHRAGRSAR